MSLLEEFMAYDRAGANGRAATSEGEEADPTRPRRIKRAGDLQATPPNWLIDGVLAQDTLAVLVGKEATYKSFVALDMAASVETGQPWAGQATVRGPVLYLCAEGQAGIARRIRAWEIVRKVSLANLAILPAPTDLLDPVALADLETDIDALEPRPALIVVDTLARHMGGDENSTPDMNVFVKACDRLREITGAAVLVVHHENKQGIVRGNTALLGGVDTWLSAKRSEDTVTIGCEKQKDSADFTPLRLKAHVTDLGLTDDLGRPVTSLVLKPTEAGGETEAVPVKQIRLLALIYEAPAGLTATEWEKAAKDEESIPAPTFKRLRRVLDDGGYLQRPDERRGGRYHLTTKGIKLVSRYLDDTDT